MAGRRQTRLDDDMARLERFRASRFTSSEPCRRLTNLCAADGSCARCYADQGELATRCDQAVRRPATGSG